MFFKSAPPPAWPYATLRARQRDVPGRRDTGYGGAVAMRQPPRRPARPAAQAPLALPPLGVVAWNRAAFGPRPGDVAAFDLLGADDDARLTAWVDTQLDPASIDDSDCDARIAASAYATLGKTYDQLWQQHFLPDNEWEERERPATETVLATWTRAVYSERQLLESMVHFWHNHFNVYAFEFVEGPLWVVHDRDVMRANALGNFRTLLGAVARSPAMLVYLDNYVNFADGGVGYSNENYSRELMELHTLGATASYGKTPRGSVPVDGNGMPLGYCEEDVQDMARALTGWTFDIDWISWEWGGGNSGQFVHVDALHSGESKTLLGTVLPAGQGAQQDGEAALDRLASHPACGRFLARKLLRRFVCDFPDTTCPDLLASAAVLWTSLWQDPQQIKKVMRHILLSTEFRTTWGEKIKRPFEILVSAMRAGGMQLRFFQQIPAPADWNSWDPDFRDTMELQWMFESAGQDLFGWHPPNGHPDVRAAWQSATPRVALWRLVDELVELQDGSDAWRLDALGQTPAEARTAAEVVDFWLPRIFGRTLPAATRDVYVDFMAQGFNPALDLPLDTNDWPYYWQDRLRALVGLLLMSPEFLWR